MIARHTHAVKIAALVLFTIAVFYAALLLRSARTLRDATFALEKDGRPMQPGQLIPSPVPDADNASPLYQVAALQLKATPFAGKTNLFDRLGTLLESLKQGTLHASQQHELRQLLAQESVSNSLALIRKGVGMPACRYPLDYSKGPGILLPHLSDLRLFSRILYAQVRLQAEAGDPAAAWDTALLGLRFAQALEKEPLLVSQLVRRVQVLLALDTIRALARQTLPTDAQNAALAELLARFDDQGPVVMAMDSERLFLGEWCFSKVAKDLTPLLGDSGALQIGPLAVLRYSPFWNLDHAAYLRIMRRYTQQASLPYTQTDNSLEESLLRDVPRYCVLTRLITPALGQVKPRFVDLAAERRVTQAGLAVLRHHQATGSWPDSLAAAGADAFPDPYTGKPLCYRKTDAGAAVYSVGSDLKDDGGSTEKDSNNKPVDLVWRF